MKRGEIDGKGGVCEGGGLRHVPFLNYKKPKNALAPHPEMGTW